MKRNITVLFFVFLSSISFSQLFEYEIKLKNVETTEASKQILDPLRETFNHYTEPFKFALVFDDAIDVFKVSSTIYVSEAELQMILEKHNFTLLQFTTKKL